jgi:Ca2+-dependent lipid-binding protein
VQWLNDVLNKLWPSISSATEAVIMESLQPILKANCPAYLTSLDFSRITLGTIAPVIVGIRHCPNDDNCLRLDIELKWAGNPEVNLSLLASPCLSFSLDLSLAVVLLRSSWMSVIKLSR